MAVPIEIETLAFDPADAKATLAQLPTAPAVFALCFDRVPTDRSSSVGRGAEAHAEPYIGRTPNLRGRLERLLQPSEKHPRRLQLAGRVRQIRWRLTGSEFEGLLLQFELLQNEYGTKSLERMHLGAPSFVRFLGGNAYPRITVTTRPSQREAAWSYGPFPSRPAAERFADEALKLFLLRRCTEELAPRPDHPGCVYSEMKMCLAPCYQGCTDARYAQEAVAVERFLVTRGESSLVQLRTERDAASANLEFEAAAAVHAQVQRVESVRSLASELVRPLAELRAVILQASAVPGEVAVFLYENGRLSGPQCFSTQGMRIQNENADSISLFAHSMAIEPIPEAVSIEAANSKQVAEIHSAEPDLYQSTTLVVPIMPQKECGALAPEGCFSENTPASSPYSDNIPAESDSVAPARLSRTELEARMEAALAALAEPAATSPTLRQGHLALLKRWYYRPEARRAGEIFFPDAEGRWPRKALLRGVGRVAAS
jgi:hypothetical protein